MLQGSKEGGGIALKEGCQSILRRLLGRGPQKRGVRSLSGTQLGEGIAFAKARGWERTHLGSCE